MAVPISTHTLDEKIQGPCTNQSWDLHQSAIAYNLLIVSESGQGGDNRLLEQGIIDIWLLAPKPRHKQLST